MLGSGAAEGAGFTTGAPGAGVAATVGLVAGSSGRFTATRGVAGVRLQSFAVGHRRFTTPFFFQKWIADVTAAKLGRRTELSSNSRAASKERAHKELLAEGLVDQRADHSPFSAGASSPKAKAVGVPENNCRDAKL